MNFPNILQKSFKLLHGVVVEIYACRYKIILKDGVWYQSVFFLFFFCPGKFFSNCEIKIPKFQNHIIYLFIYFNLLIYYYYYFARFLSGFSVCSQNVEG
jgi:hypothetical protein